MILSLRKKALKNTNFSCFIVTNKHVFENSNCLTNVFGMFSSQLCIDGRILVQIPSKNELEKPKSHSSRHRKRPFLMELKLNLQIRCVSGKVCESLLLIPGGKVENSTVLILGHCYFCENVQKFRSPDSLTYGRRDKTRTFILFSKVL